MKVKTDFTTNSSSSSFIFMLEKVPETVEELRKILFGDQEFLEYDSYHGEVKCPTLKIAETVFESIKEGAISMEGMARVVDSGYVCGGKSYNLRYEDFKDENGNLDWIAYDGAKEKLAEEWAMNFLEENASKFAFKAHYSDNDGEYWSMMEHGGIFRNIPCVQISHH